MESRLDFLDNISDFDKRVCGAAIFYAEHGLKVIPLRPGTKIPLEKRTGMNYQSASRNPDTLKKWFGKGGKYNRHNIGLVCGEDLFAVDVDDNDSWDKIKPEDWAHEGPIQSTPSGGFHYVFKWKIGAKNSTGKMAPGIDTRGSRTGGPASHIVAWPSVVGTGEYKWVQFGKRLPEIPDWICSIAGINGQWPPKSEGEGRGNEDVDWDDLEDRLEPKELWKLLCRIDLNAKHEDEYVMQYEDWCSCGMAIHTQHPDQIGYDLFERWSTKGDRHEANDVESRWDGFDDTGDVRLGTLMHYARLFDLKRKVKDPECKDIIDEVNKTYAVVQVGGSIKILQEREVQPDTPWEAPYTLLDKRGFQLLFENQKVELTTINKTVLKPVSEIWLASEKRRTLEGINFYPGKGKIVNGHYNVWAGWSMEPEPGEWGLFKDFILEIVANGNKDHYEWILDWVADIYQHPADPKGVALVMAGIEGCGKGTFASIIGETFYQHYRHLFQEEHLVGRFNAQLMGSVLVFADEMLYGGNRKAANVLKGLVTEKFIMGERKGVDTSPIYNCTRVMIASNESWFIPAGPQARRWFCLDFSREKTGNTKYFGTLIKQMKEGGKAAMMHELMNRAITNDLRKAPQTKLLKDQQARYSYGDPMVRWWIRKVNSKNLGVTDVFEQDLNNPALWPEHIHKEDLMSDFQEFDTGKFPTSPAVFYKDVLKFGVETVKKSVNGVKQRVYKVPKIREAEDILAKDFGTVLRDDDE